MKTMRRICRWLATLAMVSAAGIVPSCASMGGGGMHYDILSGQDGIAAIGSM